MTRSKTKPAAERVLRRLRDQILVGERRPGDSLPGERELSEQLGVSRPSLRAALKRLEGEGLLRSQHGAPTRVLDFRQAGGLSLLGHLARLQLASGVPPIGLLRDVMELRRAVAVEVVGIVTARATDAARAEIRLRLEEMREALGDRDAFQEREMAFSRQLVTATENLPMRMIFGGIERLVRDHAALRPTHLADPEATLRASEAIADAISEGDPDAARARTRASLRELDEATLGRLS